MRLQMDLSVDQAGLTRGVYRTGVRLPTSLGGELTGDKDNDRTRLDTSARCDGVPYPHEPGSLWAALHAGADRFAADHIRPEKVKFGRYLRSHSNLGQEEFLRV
jgi:hypothetical protein